MNESISEHRLNKTIQIEKNSSQLFKKKHFFDKKFLSILYSIENI